MVVRANPYASHPFAGRRAWNDLVGETADIQDVGTSRHRPHLGDRGHAFLYVGNAPDHFTLLHTPDSSGGIFNHSRSSLQQGNVDFAVPDASVYGIGIRLCGESGTFKLNFFMRNFRIIDSDIHSAQATGLEHSVEGHRRVDGGPPFTPYFHDDS